MHCFGVAYNNPEQIMGLLVRAKFIDSPREALVVAKTLPKATDAKVVLLLRAHNFNRRVQNLSRYQGRPVFVFDSPLHLTEIKGLIPFDYAATSSPIDFAKRTPSVAALRAAMRRAPDLVRRKRLPHLETLIDSCREGSLLNPLMSFIYTLPSSTHQTPIKIACAMSLRTGRSLQTLLATLASTHSVRLTEPQAAKLYGLMDSDAAKRYYAFFSTFVDGLPKPKLDAACRASGVALYEVTYLLSVLRKNDTPSGIKL